MTKLSYYVSMVPQKIKCRKIYQLYKLTQVALQAFPTCGPKSNSMMFGVVLHCYHQKGDLVSLQYLKWSSLWQKDIPTNKVFSWRTQPWKSQGFGILPLIFIHLNIVVFLFLYIEYFIGIGYSFTNVAFSTLPIFYRALNSSFCLQLTRFFSI